MACDGAVVEVERGEVGDHGRDAALKRTRAGALAERRDVEGGELGQLRWWWENAVALNQLYGLQVAEAGCCVDEEVGEQGGLVLAALSLQTQLCDAVCRVREERE